MTVKVKFDKQLKIKIFSFVILGIIFGALIGYANINNPGSNSADSSVKYVKAEVINVEENNLSTNDNIENIVTGDQRITIRIKSGEHKDEQCTINNYVSAFRNVVVKSGDKIIVRVDTKGNGSYEFSVYNYNRAPILCGFIAVFLISLCAIGGKKGIKAMIGLLYTLISIFFILIPLIMRGYSPVLVTIFIVSITAVGSLIIIDGVSAKTLAAIIGTVSGVLISGLFTYIVGKLIHITGFNMEQAESLLLVSGDGDLKIKGLLICGVLLSSLGAVMDVAMSISSSINEIHIVNKKLRWKELFISGMNIGKDAMGTMANTLILAFTGSSLNLMLLIYSFGIPYNQLMNTDLIAIEILQGISGSLGIILAVPVTAYAASKIISRN